MASGEGKEMGSAMEPKPIKTVREGREMGSAIEPKPIQTVRKGRRWVLEGRLKKIRVGLFCFSHFGKMAKTK